MNSKDALSNPLYKPIAARRSKRVAIMRKSITMERNKGEYMHNENKD
jgi:hypothetical protein